MENRNEIKVWDPLVRIFHWSLVVAFFIAYFVSDEEQLLVHTAAGYVVLGLVLFRLVWGVVGPKHARYSDFVYPPATVIGNIKDVIRFQAKRYIGHSPAGGAMVVALLVSLLATVVTGLVLYGGAEHHAGPLAGLAGDLGKTSGEWLEEVHEFLANFTLTLVVLHVIGVIVASISHRENLIRAMFTGRKRG